MTMGPTVADGWAVENGDAAGVEIGVVAGGAEVSVSGVAAGVTVAVGTGEATGIPSCVPATGVLVTWNSGMDFCTV